MSENNSSVRLLKRWQAGDEQAADEIFDRYLQRLLALARSRLSDRLKRRLDADDVVQSVYRSFFRNAKEERYTLKRSGDLWRLLAAITMHKTINQIEFHHAAKRSVSDEESWPHGDPAAYAGKLLAERPSVDDASMLTDEIESVMQTLKPVERQVLTLRLQDRGSDEIASEVGRSTRTVRRILERIRSVLQSQFNEQTSDSEPSIE